MCFAVASFANKYAILGLVRYPGAAPAAAGAAWITSWTYAVELGLLAALLILFPAGEPPIAGLATILSIVAAVSAWPARGISMVRADAEDPPVGVSYAVHAAAFFALLACVAAGVVSLVVRFRQADADERPQVKLLLFAVVASIGGMAIVFVILVLFNVESEVVADFVLGIPIALIPIAMGSAILRFRLYDIDRLISRTVAYLLLTVVVTGCMPRRPRRWGSCWGTRAHARPVGRSPLPRWPPPRSFNQHAIASRGPSTAASTAASTMRPRPSKRSAPS